MRRHAAIDPVELLTPTSQQCAGILAADVIGDIIDEATEGVDGIERVAPLGSEQTEGVIEVARAAARDALAVGVRLAQAACGRCYRRPLPLTCAVVGCRSS